MKKTIIIGGSVVAALVLIYIGYKVYQKSKNKTAQNTVTTNPVFTPPPIQVNPSAPVGTQTTAQNR